MIRSRPSGSYSSPGRRKIGTGGPKPSWQLKGYKIALTGPTAGEDADLLTSESNLKAYSDLLLSCQDEITFG